MQERPGPSLEDRGSDFSFKEGLYFVHSDGDEGEKNGEPLVGRPPKVKEAVPRKELGVSEEGFNIRPETEKLGHDLEDTAEKDSVENSIDPELIGMYELPGDSITEKDVERYEYSKERIIGALPGLIKEGLSDEEDSSVRAKAAELIEYAPKDEQVALREQVVVLIEEGLSDKEDVFVRAKAARMIKYMPEDARAALIERVFSDESDFVRGEVAWMIEHAPEDTRVALIKKGLSDESVDVRAMTARMVEYAPKDEQLALREQIAGLIEEGFSDKEDSSVREIAARMIKDAPEDTRAALIERGFSDKDVSVYWGAAMMVEYAPKDEQVALREQVGVLIEEGLSDKEDVFVREIVVLMIEHAPEDTRVALIKKGLSDESVDVREATIQMIQYAPEDTRAALIEEGLSDEDVSVRAKAALMIECVPIDIRDELREQVPGLIKSMHVQDGIKSSELYDDVPDKFVREKFGKTGSELILLDHVPGRETSLRDRVILRHIELKAFMAWAELYEDAAFWKEHGFSYVPIEPIIRAHPDSTGSGVTTSARVLGPNVHAWTQEHARYREQIIETRQSIIDALEERGFEHGHPHDRNFCLAFEKHKDGTPDFEQVPRVYLIDFDQASS